jgi:flagellar motor protein MotB
MAGLLGAFVLILVGVLGVQLDLVTSLEAEIQKRQQEEQRREALEKALAGPLASGRVTLNNGKIGISGNVLFALNSDQLQPEGKQLLKSLSQPIAAYLGASEQMLMVSGFTDDMPVRGSNSRFTDNWELSAQRALTVTRTLIEDGVPASSIFAAAFGSQQPVADNADAEGRARNRRVEMAPVPKTRSNAKEGNG